MLTDAVDAKTTKRWFHHWQDEADAAYLYGLLARIETDPHKQEVFRKLEHVEGEHTQVWARVLGEHGVETETFQPSPRTMLMAFLAKRFGPSFLTSLLLKEEGREVRAYLTLYKESAAGSAKDAAQKLARESTEHAGDLAALTKGGPEPWHRTGSGGFLRNVVYGFNDGLTANFGLVAGVIGATNMNTLSARHRRRRRRG